MTINATALYDLSAPDVPQPVHDEALQRAADREHISKAKAEQMVADVTLAAVSARHIMV